MKIEITTSLPPASDELLELTDAEFRIHCEEGGLDYYAPIKVRDYLAIRLRMVLMQAQVRAADRVVQLEVNKNTMNPDEFHAWAKSLEPPAAQGKFRRSRIRRQR